MRQVLAIGILLLAGCATTPPADDAPPEPIRAAGLAFSFHDVHADACRPDDDLECRRYAVWFTNNGNVDLPTSELGWLFNHTTKDPLGRPTGWSATQCGYAQDSPHDFAITPARRVSLTLACLMPEGTVHDEIEVFYKPGTVTLATVAVA